MAFIDEIIEKIKETKRETANSNSRFLSWEHCYKQFYDAFNHLQNLNDEKIDYLALNLAFYLASWGMYRGSSFLLKYDYKVHISAVKLILDKKYAPLLGIYWEENNKDYEKNLNLLFDENGLIEELKEKYSEFHNGNSNISSILISKILLGTLGCIPAYDTYFKKTISKGHNEQGYTNFKQTLSKKSLQSLIQFYSENKETLEFVRNECFLDNDNEIEYPQMKVLDMGFWSYGF